MTANGGNADHTVILFEDDMSRALIVGPLNACAWNSSKFLVISLAGCFSVAVHGPFHPLLGSIKPFEAWITLPSNRDLTIKLCSKDCGGQTRLRDYHLKLSYPGAF